MSALTLKPLARNVTCRYWASLGTCFFGDKCNFAHNPDDRAASGMSVPKSEKACKELLLTGYCKNERNGCEYNHEILNMTRLGPPASSTTATNLSSSVVFSSWPSTSSTSLGTAAAIRNNRLPVSAPALVPAAVAAAQRASLSAWGGVTPGSRESIAVASPATFSVSSSPPKDDILMASSGQTSVVDPPTTSALAPLVLETEVSANSNPVSSGSTSLSSTFSSSLVNAQPFIPGNASANSGSSNEPTPPHNGAAQGTSVGSANATPFVPSGGSVTSAVSAAPFVPRSRHYLLTGSTIGGGVPPSMGRALPPSSQSPMTLGGSGPQQQLQMRQQLSQVQQQMQLEAAAQVHVHAHAQARAHMLASAARMSNNQYMGMEVPVVLPPFRLPDGDDPALGMTSMSPPNPAFLTRVGGSGGLSVLPAPDAMASMGIVGDETGVLQVDNPPFSHNYGGGLPSSSSVRAQQHLQKMQLQHKHQAFSGQSSAFSLRIPQRAGALTTDKKQQQQQLLSTQSEQSFQLSPFGIRLSQSLEAQTSEKSQRPGSQADTGGSVSSLLALSNDKQVQEHTLLSPERRESDHLSVQSLDPSGPQPTGQIQSSRQQSAFKQHHQQQQLHQQIQLQVLKQQALRQQQMRHNILQQQQSQHFQQQYSQGPLSGTGFSQQRPSSLRSASPVSGASKIAAAQLGGATYVLGPGQGISSLSHAFNSSESRSTGRGQFLAGTAPFGSRFLSDQLREKIRRRHSLIHAQLDPEQDLVDLPEMIQRFHSLFPLEDVNREDDSPSSSFGVRTMVFKGISSSDGQAYAIRRIDSGQVIRTAKLAATAVEAVERWAPFSRHPHIVAIRESFVSREVEDSAALFFVHDYYPASLTLQTLHLQQEQAGGVVHLTLNEEQLWSYMVQLATLLRAVHGAGLYFRPGGLHPSKVILTSKGQIRVSGVGILDVLHGDPADDPRIFQREDLAGCGRLMLALACGSSVYASLEFMGSHYSIDLVRVIQALLASSPEKSDGGGISSIRQLHSVLADRMFSEIENVHIQSDEIMNELSKETENGRLLRILVKLGMMSERPENERDPEWSESGDRYLLKLFRDFVFHQTSEEGTPVIDWGHVIECLNKLDAGVPEKIILLSRDERSMLVASYADLKRCLETGYQELLAKASGDKVRQGLPLSMLMQTQAHIGQRHHAA